MFAVLLLTLSYLGYGALAWLPGDRAVILAGGLGLQSLVWLWVWHRRVFSRWLWVSAVVSMVLVRGTSPLFENDYFRYYWDGWQVRATGDPYSEPPLTGAPQPQTSAVQHWINFPHLRSFYPPVIQGIFAALVGLGLEGFLWGLTLIPWGILFWLGRGQARWLWVLQHPLLMREWFQAVHFDGWVAVALLGMAVGATPFVRGFFVGLGTGVKAVPLLVSPLLRERRFHTLFLGGLLGLGVGAAWWGDFVQTFGTWKAFTEGWEMNSGMFRWIRNGGYWGLGWEWAKANQWSRLVVAGMWGACVLCLYRRWDRPARIFWATYLLILFSPVANPWYVTWVLPLVPFLPRFHQLPLFLSWSVLGVAYFYYRPQLDTVEGWWTAEHIVLWLGVVWAFGGRYLMERYHRLSRGGEMPSTR